MEQEKESTFRVTDKRSASQDKEHTPGEGKKQEPETSKPEESSQQQESASQTQGGNTRVHEDSSIPVPEANFVNLLFSLYAHAQICLGIMPDPMTQQTYKDVAQAKYNIDMLGVLQEKTKGNLTQEEKQALEQMLYEVRMAYVQAGK